MLSYILQDSGTGCLREVSRDSCNNKSVLYIYVCYMQGGKLLTFKMILSSKGD